MISYFTSIRIRQWLTALCILLGVVVYLYGGLLTNVPLRNHEAPSLYFRLHQYVTEITYNGFPPSLFPDAIYGGGFAFPLFYPPFSNLLGVLIAVICKSYYFAGNFALFLSVLASAYTAFYGFWSISKYSTALTASTLYVTIPYRFVDAIVRGALAECWSFAWYPLIFCGGVLLLRGENRKGFLMITIATAFLILSHAVMAIYFIGICVVIFAITCVSANRLVSLAYSVVAMVFAAGLTAWYAIPQRILWETVKASEMEFMWAVLDGVRRHNVSISQLFYSDQNRWLGGSFEGVVKDGMSFELGYANFLTALVFVMGLFWYGNRRSWQHRSETVLKWLTIGTWLASIIFVLRCQVFLKFAPDSLMFIQFPWRMLGITAFFCVASYVLTLSSYRLTYRVRLLLTVVAIVGSIASIDSSYRIVQYMPDLPEEPLTTEKVRPYGDKGYVEIREYVPKEFIDQELKHLKGQKVASIGSIDITPLTENYKERTYSVNANTSATMIMPLIAYPVYEATTADGRELELSSRNGLLLVVGIQPGDTQVTVRRVLSDPQLLGICVTIATLVLLIVMLFLPVWKVPNRHKRGDIF